MTEISQGRHYEADSIHAPTVDGKLVWEPYGLRDWFCGSCGRAKSYRLYGFAVGCPECDEVATAHRCVGLPDADSLDAGDRWDCHGCRSIWAVVEREDVCGECGRAGMANTWERVLGPQVPDPPRYDGRAAWLPFRPFLAENRMRHKRVELPKACYRARAGFMVHVKDVCECAGRKK